METGFLKPVVYAIDIKFGNSYFYHDNAIVAFIMNQFVEFAIVVIENSTYFVGQYIFTSMLGPLMTSFLNNYTVNFPIKDILPGQTGSDNFILDFKHTTRPYIGEGWIDMFIVGELTTESHPECNIEPEVLDFMDNQRFSQLVISESAFTCMIN